jgi:hypothetical protein
MLHVYLYLESLEVLRSKCTIDMSRIPLDKLADECDNIIQHHRNAILFLGYIDVGWMLDPKHETRIRHCIRKFETHVITLFKESIPYSWKNEIDTLYFKSTKNGSPEIINDGSIVHD